MPWYDLPALYRANREPVPRRQRELQLQGLWRDDPALSLPPQDARSRIPSSAGDRCRLIAGSSRRSPRSRCTTGRRSGGRTTRSGRRSPRASPRRGIAAPPKLDRDRADRRRSGAIPASSSRRPAAGRSRRGCADTSASSATPVYDVPGCDGPLYSSMIVARADSSGERLRAIRAAPLRLQQRRQPLRLRRPPRRDATRPASSRMPPPGSRPAAIAPRMRAVAAGEADIAAIDAVCWALALQLRARKRPAALKVVGATPLRPGLPFITAVERHDSEVEARSAQSSGRAGDPRLQRPRKALGLAGVGPLRRMGLSPDRPRSRGSRQAASAASRAARRADSATAARIRSR